MESCLLYHSRGSDEVAPSQFHALFFVRGDITKNLMLAVAPPPESRYLSALSNPGSADELTVHDKPG